MVPRVIRLIAWVFVVAGCASAPSTPSATAAPSALTSSVVVWPTTLSPNGASTSTITIQLRDADGNDLTTGGHEVTIDDPGAVFQCPVDAGCLGSIGAVVDHGDGTYSATYTAGTTEGAVTLRPRLEGEPMSSGASVTLAFFLLAENGVTVTCPDAAVGATGTVNGTTYTKRDRQQLRENRVDSDYVSTACTSGITDMSYMFHYLHSMQADLSTWDTSDVTSMMAMFDQSGFNGDIAAWNTGKVTNMTNMFFAAPFDQDIGAWDTGSLENMYGMFSYSPVFDRDIGGWDTSKVTDMRNLFFQATAFDHDLSGWCVEAVTQWVGFDDGATSWSDANKPVWGAPCAPSP